MHSEKSIQEISLNDLPELLDIYHEILLNEIAVVRGNTIFAKAIPSSIGFIAYSDFPNYTYTDTERALDYATLLYAILNAIRRVSVGYDLQDLTRVDRRDAERTQEELEKLVKKVRFKANYVDWCFEESPTRSAGAGYNLMDNLNCIVLVLLHLGLVKPVFVVPEDNLNFLDSSKRLLEGDKLKEGSQVIKAESVRDLIRLRHYYQLARFFSSFGITPDGVSKAYEELKRRIGIDREIFFKTMHGELFRMVSFARALPDRITNYESHVLPFIANPRMDGRDEGSSGRKGFRNAGELREPLRRYFENAGVSSTDADKMASAIIKSLEKAGYGKLRLFQYKYLSDIFERSSKSKAGSGLDVVLSSPVASGKTLVFTLFTIAKILAHKLGNQKAHATRFKAVLIYPRKSLASDQLKKMIELLYFLNKELEGIDKNLKIKASIRDGDSLKNQYESGEPKSLRDLEINTGGRRAKLRHGYSDEGYYVELVYNDLSRERLDWLFDAKDVEYNDVDILVTNEVMLYQLSAESILFENEFRKFARGVGTIVIDEAHIYRNAENLEKLSAALTAFIIAALRESSDPIGELRKFDFVVSSATLTNRGGAGGSGSLSPSGILGIINVRKLDEGSKEYEERVQEVRGFIRTIVGESLYDRLGERELVYHDYSSLLYESFIQQQSVYRGGYKLDISMITHPFPEKSSKTSLNESLVTVLHWTNALRLLPIREVKRAFSIAFIDSRESLEEIYRYFVGRQIVDAMDHVDRVLLSFAISKEGRDSDKRRRGVEVIESMLNHFFVNQHRQSLLDVLFSRPHGSNGGDTLMLPSRFHNLSFYLTLNKLKKIKQVSVENAESVSTGIKQVFPEVFEFVSEVSKYGSLPSEGNRILEPGGKIYVACHHGLLERELRHRLEQKMRGGEAYLVFSTSTLEVGVDFPNLALTVQYGSEPNPSELQQRWGRSGRSIDSLYVSTLVLVQRNTGEDLSLLDPLEAFRYVFNLRPIMLGAILPRDLLISRVATSIVNKGTKEKVRDPELKKGLQEILEKIFGASPHYYEEWLNTVRGFSSIDIKSKKCSNYDSLFDEINSECIQGENMYFEEIKSLLHRLKKGSRSFNPLALIYMLENLRQSLKQKISRECRDALFILRNCLIRELEEILPSALKSEGVGKIPARITPPGVYSDLLVTEKFVYILESGKSNYESIGDFVEASYKVRPLRSRGGR